MTSRPTLPWSKVRECFERALPLSPAAREALLADPALDPAIAAEVRTLLAHEVADEPDGFLAQPAAAAPDASRQGQRLGAWLIVERLGVGGMGEVWLAERADGAYNGQAAIKVLRRGMDSSQVLQRFAQEQQALARLQHPHIAQLIDAGRTPDGLPFFVMQQVQGQPIDAACVGLPLPARLALFLQLADAVSYAHRSLLVHRDLKPSNVLVTAQGQVKLLDFGIAKALDPLDAAGLDTVAGERPFTPLYASPEQVRGEPMGTATDIYSLGVLLYVMLTGVRPYGRQASSAREAARSVLEEAPTRPSALSPQAAPDPQWLALRQRLKGDLDNILLKALAKEIEPRYASVDAMAADVRRYLAGQPVSARAPTLTYLTSKFVRRHPVGVGTGSAALLAVLCSAALALWQAGQATRARAQAEARLAQVGEITRDVVLRYGDAMTSMSGGLQVKEQMLQGLIVNLEKLVQEADGNPVWQADLAGAYARLAEVQGNDTGLSVGKPQAALPNAERAIALAQSAWPKRSGDARLADAYASALQIRAQAQRAQGQPQEGLPSLERAMAVLDETLARLPAPEQRPLRLRRAGVLLTLAQLHDQQSIANLNQPERALAFYAQAEQELLALDHAQADLESGNLLGTLHGGRALTHGRLSQLEAACADAQQALVFRKRAVDAEPGNVMWRDGLVTEATNAGVILLRAGDAAGALQATTIAWDQVLSLARENGPGNQWLQHQPRVAAHHGRALLQNGRFAEAGPVLQEALAMWRTRQQKQPTPHTERMVAWMSLQQAKADYGAGASATKRAAAVALAQPQVAVLARLGQAPNAKITRDALLNLGEACLFLSQADSPAREAWRTRARQAYAQANAAVPLTGDHLTAFKSAGG